MDAANSASVIIKGAMPKPEVVQQAAAVAEQTAA
jgi:hypothetical protein